MSSSRTSAKNGVGKSSKRALPSWMSARDDENENDKDDDGQVGGMQKKGRGEGKAVKDVGEGTASRKETLSAGPGALTFSKLLDGVVFVLSGFVNPERGKLRSQAMEMGAEYQPDWNPNCTILVCAFPNTPKFRQVEADNGTIVSKDWITECYTQKMLVDIETYLMHVGKPWRKRETSFSAKQAHESSPSSTSYKQEAKQPQLEPPSTSKGLRDSTSRYLQEKFSPSNVKNWVVDDLNRTLTWLESQEEKPEPSEIRNVAAEGILTCLQDAIDLLNKEQDLKQLTEQWNTVPYVVQELIKLQDSKDSSLSVSEVALLKVALTCKKIYMDELKARSNTLSKKNDKPKPDKDKFKEGRHGLAQEIASNSTGYESDETIEMTEDEINHAYNSIVSKMPK